MPLVTNIQKFSIHDGDGVRTTVFFKGCPLKCMWCHNPETQRFYAEMMLDEGKCVGCGMCEHICPNGAVKMTAAHADPTAAQASGTPGSNTQTTGEPNASASGTPGSNTQTTGEPNASASTGSRSLATASGQDGATTPTAPVSTVGSSLPLDDSAGQIADSITPIGSQTAAVASLPRTDLALCTQCGKCEKYCTAVCRELVGREYTVKELIKELVKDRMFYEDSGGGVTLSGGEVMSMDIEYILALAKALDREDISLTIDTCGYTEYEKFERLLPYVNTFLYDVKVMNPELHRKYIGVDNELILDNLKKLSGAGARIYIRIPTIKGVSGTDENMQATIDFLKKNDIRVAQVNLLPYHDTGSGKYSRIGKEYEGTELQAPTKEEMEHYAQLFKDAGYTNTKIGG